MKKNNEFSVPLMAFTFFFAVVIYLLFLGYHFWQKNIDNKSEK